MKRKLGALSALMLAMVWCGMQPATGGELSADAIVQQTHLALFYPGDDLKARVRMRLVTKDGKERLRELTMLRRNVRAGGEQKYFIYFHRPGDVRSMVFMVWKYPARDDDRWLYVPAIDLVKRIAARDKRSSFVGSDFTYEDISGREVEADRHALRREEPLNGRPAYVIESLPKEEAEYTRKLAWIDKATFLPLKEEYYDPQGKLYKVFSADEVREVQGFPTIIKRTMQNVQTDHRSEVTFEAISYNVGLEDDLFSERYLRRPPGRWVE